MWVLTVVARIGDFRKNAARWTGFAPGLNPRLFRGRTYRHGRGADRYLY